MAKATLTISSKNYSSWSLRGWLLTRFSGLEFDEIVTSPDDASARAEILLLSSSILVPCLRHDGATVWDTLAIAEYLAERHPGVWPSDSKARAWARCATAEMHSGFGPLRTHCPMMCGLRIRLADDLPPSLRADIARIDELWNEGLTRFGGPFLAGSAFGAVDAFFAPVAFRIQTYDVPLGDAATAYAQRLRELPGMRRWYADALQETWRDAIHEDEAKQCGTMLEDLRAPVA